MGDEIVIYRGIRTGSKKINGMSWTTDIEVAKWFSKRFNLGQKVGNVYEASVSRSDILAYFLGRSEHEIVVDPRGLRNVKRIDVVE